MEKASRFFLIPLAFLLITRVNAHSTSQGDFFASVDADEFSIFEENGKVGLKNEQGRVLIPAQFEAIGWSDGRFSLIGNITGYLLDGRWGLIHLNNHRVTPPRYESLLPGYGTVIVGGLKAPGSWRTLHGCIDTNGKQVIPFQYDGIKVYPSRAVVYVKQGSRYNHGLLDFDNRVIIPLQFRNIYPLGSLRYAVENFDRKTALFSEDGSQVMDFVIDSLSAFTHDHAVIYQDGNQGLIDRQGRLVLPAQYCEIRIGEDRVVMGRDYNHWLFLSGDNGMLKECYADSVAVTRANVYALYRSGTVRLAGPDLKPLSEDIYSRVTSFSKERAVAVVDHRAGVVDPSGRFIISPSFMDIRFDGEFVKASRMVDGRVKWMLLGPEGNPVSAKSYDDIGSWNGRFFPVKSRGFWGAMDRNGKEMIACVHDSLVQWKDENVVVRFKGGYGVIGIDETWKVTPQRYPLELINDSLYLLKRENTTFLKGIRKGIIYFSDNRLEVREDHLLEYLTSGALWKIDFSGTIKERYELPSGIEEISDESEGLRAIRRDGRYGFIDAEGRLRIANRYEAARNFSSSLAAVRILGRWGFINRQDNIAIQPVYDEVSSFVGDYAIVRQNNLVGVVGKNGQLVLPVRYDSIAMVSGNRFKLMQQGRWGLADDVGRLTVSPKYDDVADLGNGFVIVSRQGRYGVLTVQGVSTIPEIYDWLAYDERNGQFIALERAPWKELKRL